MVALSTIRYTLYRHEGVDIWRTDITANSDNTVFMTFYEIDRLHDRHGEPYIAPTLSEAHIVITKALNDSLKYWKLCQR